MAKKGGTKRKIPISKIEKKESLRTAYTKRCQGLFSKASQFCSLSGSQIAILATPPSSQSNVSFNSFGHSSVDTVVTSFLAGHMTQDIDAAMDHQNLGLGSWWEDEGLLRSANPQELNDALESMSTMIKRVRELDAVKKKKENRQSDAVLKPLNLQSNSEFCCIPDDLQITNSEIDVFDGSVYIIENSNNNNILAAGNLDEWSNQEMDCDKLIDYESTFESLLADGVFDSSQEYAESIWMNSDAVEDENREDNPRFSEIFNDLTTIVGGV